MNNAGYKMNSKELVNECNKFGEGNVVSENKGILPKIPLEDMRELTKIMFIKK